MLDSQSAKLAASHFILQNMGKSGAAEVMSIDSATREETFGWVFFWNSKRYIETHDPEFALCGNLPIVVLRETGTACFLPHRPGSRDITASIQAFARSL